jgi:glucose-6-phosphate 1-dehydrogenase
VPFYLRAGKLMPVNRTEVIVKLRRPPPISGVCFAPNHVRFRLGPEFVIALGANVREGSDVDGHELELLAAHDHAGTETDPYAELLGDALRGETYRFARQDYVEEAWRIVDPMLAEPPEPIPYEPGTFGPPEAEALVPGGWLEPPSSAGSGNWQAAGGI